jgi:hypothetical protein
MGVVTPLPMPVPPPHVSNKPFQVDSSIHRGSNEGDSWEPEPEPLNHPHDFITHHPTEGQLVI